MTKLVNFALANFCFILAYATNSLSFLVDVEFFSAITGLLILLGFGFLLSIVIESKEVRG